MPSNDLPIGIFDSGVGGLTVLRAVRDLLPAENIIYLGDTARLPYGTKSAESVQRYALHAADYLVSKGIKLLVVACNTASALALEQLQARLSPIPVVGVVEPGAAAAVAASQTQRHLVLATEATTAQQAYTRAILRLRSDAVVEELPCSIFVALAEEGWHEGNVAELVASEYLAAINQCQGSACPDTVILGCTHFPLLRPAIQNALSKKLFIVDSATTTADEVLAQLTGNNLLQTHGTGGLQLIATDGAARFARVGSRFLGQPFAQEDIELVDIHPTDA